MNALSSVVAVDPFAAHNASIERLCTYLAEDIALLDDAVANGLDALAETTSDHIVWLKDLIADRVARSAGLTVEQVRAVFA